jgi:hypothetical protein
MRKGETKGQDKLQQVQLRLTQKKLREITEIVNASKDETVSSVVRKILLGKTIKVYRHDETTDLLLEELASLRAEIKAIGVNINQITKKFNTYPELKRKEFYGKIAFAEYMMLEAKIEKLLVIMGKLSKKWLSE